MDPLLVSAASGMKARMEVLDLLANNIANSGTTGFKADREFYSLYEQQLPLVGNRWTDFSQGTLLATDNPLHLALSGPGFFALNGSAGTVYSRSGSFQISKSNQLETSDGYTLRNARDEGRPIKVDPALEIVIGKDGVVTQAGQPVGQIEIGEIPSAADAVAKLGSTYFALTSGARVGLPGVGLPGVGLPGVGLQGAARATPTEVLQGQLEQSNVPVADTAVRLVGVMRQFEMLQKAMNIGSQMSKEAIQEVARVG
jgi:flagellar basal body rod protein FlgG